MTLEVSYTKNHGKTLDASHVCRFQVALSIVSAMLWVKEKGDNYHSDKILVSHLFNGNVID
jgi:hypothetical protein